MDDSDFLKAFEVCSLDLHAFRHRDHVKVAWLYLREHPAPVVLLKMREGLLRLARAAGQESIYNETVTSAFVLLINERMERTGTAASFDEFATRNADLFDRAAPILERYYRPETLRSDLAKRIFVFPDRPYRTPGPIAPI